MKTIAYQGAEGAFSHLTALKSFGTDNHFIAVKSFKDAFEWVKNEDADFAVVPLENNLVGSIYENYDLLCRYSMHIVSEHLTKIDHCLLTISAPCRYEDIRKVYSHPKALEQCSRFFQKHPWMEAIPETNTAVAAQNIALKGDPTCAAIASAGAAKLYALQIVEENIADNSHNYTRFVTIAKKQQDNPLADKCSLLLEIEHAPGSLVSALTQFANHGINLTKIESRPHGTSFEYLFYIDLEFKGKKQHAMEQILVNLSSAVSRLQLLGFYTGASWAQ